MLNYEAVVGSTTIYTDLYMVDSDGAASTSFVMILPSWAFKSSALL